MTDKKEPKSDLTDTDLDAVTGGYNLDGVFVKSWSTSGDADGNLTEVLSPNFGQVSQVAKSKGTKDGTDWKIEEGDD